MDAKVYPVTRTDAEWRKLLTREQYDIMRKHGTEAPGSCALNFEKRAGTFICAGCDQPLFVSKKKFESGTGWPSFNDPEPGSVETTTDRAYGMVRTEVHCSRCGSHLGHVFPDGPPPTGQRYCINGVALKFCRSRHKARVGSLALDGGNPERTLCNGNGRFRLCSIRRYSYKYLIQRIFFGLSRRMIDEGLTVFLTITLTICGWSVYLYT